MQDQVHRLAKALALGERSTSNPNEASVALAKAVLICQSNKISLAELVLKGHQQPQYSYSTLQYENIVLGNRVEALELELERRKNDKPTVRDLNAMRREHKAALAEEQSKRVAIEELAADRQRSLELANALIADLKAKLAEAQVSAAPSDPQANTRPKTQLKPIGAAPHKGKWRAQASVNGKIEYFGLHPSHREAAFAASKGVYAMCGRHINAHIWSVEELNGCYNNTVA